ncbi:phospholipase [Raoultella planticola]|uniref:Phospholipase n=1 Tax=Raoultella planticola TaxID=575 RepID=A0A443VEU5_RAOPL|nr:phospholipase [Raoultella planticola]
MSYLEIQLLSGVSGGYINSKIVIGDEGLLCVGSFNWFSATRDERYQRYDTSMVYRGESLKSEIKTIYSSLEQRQL